MLRERNKLIVRTHRVLDICLTAAAFVAAYFIKKYILPAPFRGLSIVPNYYIVLLMVIIIWYMTFSLCGLYISYRKQTFAKIFRDMAKAVCVGMIILTLVMYVFKLTDVSRLMLGLFFLINIGLLGLSKGLAHRILAHYRKKGFNFRNILIVGSRDGASQVIDHIKDRPEDGFRVLGCLEIDENAIGKKVKDEVYVIDTIDSLEKVLREEVVDELVFSMPLKEIEDVKRYFALAEEVGVRVRILPDWQIRDLGYKSKIGSVHFEEFLGIQTMALVPVPNEYRELLIKSAFDHVFAAVALIVCLPLFIGISIAIKVASRGPVFFRQERSGLNGRRFIFYKFRTMVADAEARRKDLEALNEMNGPVFKIRKDPRIIPFIGTFLRKTSLDELPQLINVFKGEMSLVGPRPPIPAEVENYDVWQRRRLSMKPGLTCLWQIRPHRNQVDFEEWVNLDLRYIDEWSLKLDFKILVRTAWVMVTGTGR